MALDLAVAGLAAELLDGLVHVVHAVEVPLGQEAAVGLEREGPARAIEVAGGLLSEGYLHGMNHVYEAVEQIRGEAGHRQVERHDTALVTGQLGYVSGYSSAALLVGA